MSIKLVVRVRLEKSKVQGYFTSTRNRDMRWGRGEAARNYKRHEGALKCGRMGGVG